MKFFIIHAIIIVIIANIVIGINEDNITLHVSINENITAKNMTIGKFTINVTTPEVIYINKSFNIRVSIQNPTPEEFEYTFWSYVYKGSVSFSGERESNNKTISISNFSNVAFDLENVVDATPGIYKLKIKALKKGIKTPKEFTLDIEVVEILEQNVLENAESNSSLITNSSNTTSQPSKTNNKKEVIISNVKPLQINNMESNESNKSSSFKSSSAKAKDLSFYILLGVFTLILVGVILKKF